MAQGVNDGFKKIVLFIIVVLTGTCPVLSQYYYKDLVTTRQVNHNFKLYKSNKIVKVALNSFQGNVPVTEGFVGEQEISLAQNRVFTYTKTSDRGESFFTAFYNPGGLLIKTIDSTLETAGTAIYQYDANTRLTQVSRETHAVDNSSSISEVHFWEYNPEGHPTKMTRVKNKADTTIVVFIVDEKGNVVEEDAKNRGTSMGKIFYYYDDKNRLTDVVRFHYQSGRLLPDYIFEYEDNGELSTMTIVPEGTNDYQKWYYKYDDNGLKLVEFCYDKKSTLLGKIEYDYTAAR